MREDSAKTQRITISQFDTSSNHTGKKLRRQLRRETFHGLQANFETHIEIRQVVSFARKRVPKKSLRILFSQFSKIQGTFNELFYSCHRDLNKNN